MIFVFAQNDEVLTSIFDFCPGIFPEQNRSPAITSMGRMCRSRGFLPAPTATDFAFLRFFLGAIGNDDSALYGFLLFNPLYQHSIVQWAKFH